MSDRPLELWPGVKGKYFRGLTLEESMAQAKISRTDQHITDIMLSGYNQPIQNYDTTPQHEWEKDFTKVFEQLSIHKPRV